MTFYRQSRPSVSNHLTPRVKAVRFSKRVPFPEIRARDVEFALFSKNGFVEGLADDVDADWSLFGPREMEALL